MAAESESFVFRLNPNRLGMVPVMVKQPVILKLLQFYRRRRKNGAGAALAVSEKSPERKEVWQDGGEISTAGWAPASAERKSGPAGDTQTVVGGSQISVGKGKTQGPGPGSWERRVQTQAYAPQTGV
jgi:hypothetical protein